jgi:homoserine dehydrogenase
MAEALRVGVAGLGTVGASVVRVLAEKASELTRQCGRPIAVTAVSARDPDRDRGISLGDAKWFDDPTELAKSADIDVFVELIGGEEGVARQSVRAALDAGRHVVTANKALLARHGLALAEIAEKKGVLLNYEAAVAGGIPVIKTLREALAGNSVGRIFGILNGTCNYILTRMEAEGLSFDECLKDAQRLGYAEADPTFDIEGHDTAHKLAILTSIAFGCRISAGDIYMEGISNITQADIQAAGELLLSGPGAAGNATASAVIGDIADIAKSRPGFQHGPVFGWPAKELKPYRKAKMRAHAGGYFIRLTVHDRIGVFAAIAKRMADSDISLESIVQHAGGKRCDNQKTVILVTHETTEAAVRRAVEGITRDRHLIDKPQVIRIERAG